METKKETAVSFIEKKIKGKGFFTYKEIAEITGYHPKYILKLKKEILSNTIHLVHGNKNRKPINSISLDEELKIVNLYRRSNVSIRRFCKFYDKRSYSCIYNVLKKHNLINNEAKN